MGAPHWGEVSAWRTGVGFSNAGVWDRVPSCNWQNLLWQFSRRDVIKYIYILRCSGGQEISLCGYSEKHHPAATTGLLSEWPTAASAGHPHRSWYHCFWALNAALCTFWLLRPDPSADTLLESGFHYGACLEWGMVTGLPSTFMTPPPAPGPFPFFWLREKEHHLLVSGSERPFCQEASRPLKDCSVLAQPLSVE